MRKRLRGILLALAVAFVLVFIALIAFTNGRSTPLPPLPNPNGYDDFLQAAKLLTGDIGNYGTLDHNGLREVVSSNTGSLRLLRLGLTRTCAVPTEAALTNFAGMMSDLPKLKLLAHLLIAEG